MIRRIAPPDIDATDIARQPDMDGGTSIDAIESWLVVFGRLLQLPDATKQAIRDALLDHTQYIHGHGDDIPTISGWQWGRQGSVPGQAGSTESDNV